MFDFFLDLIFPKFCLGCNRSQTYLCLECQKKLESGLGHQPVIKDQQYLDKVLMVAGYHQPLLADLIHCFKYQYVTELGEYLSRLAVDCLIESGEGNFDAVVPVPLSRQRLASRGFNQAEIIAQRISEQLGWPLNTRGLIRKLNNRPQVGLTAAQRRRNVKGVFSLVDHEFFQGKKVLLVDDVLTTGTTMDQCARLLKRAGATEIIGLVILKAD